MEKETGRVQGTVIKNTAINYSAMLTEHKKLCHKAGLWYWWIVRTDVSVPYHCLSIVYLNEQSRLLIAVPYHPISFWLSDEYPIRIWLTRVAYEHYQEFSWDMRVTTKSTWYIGGLQTMREEEHFRYLNMCREFRNLGLYSSNSWLQLQLKFSLKSLKAFYWSHNVFWADQHNLPWYYSYFRDFTETFEENL